MKKVKLNFEGVESFGKLEEGIHEIEITKLDYGKSTQKGTNLLKVYMKSTENGTGIIHDLYLTKKALWKIKEFLEAIGEDVPNGEFVLDPDKYIGRVARIDVYHEEYDGKVYAKVDAFMKPSITAPSEEIADEPTADEDDDLLDLL